MDDKELPKPPERSKGDDIHAAGNVGVSVAGTLIGSAVGIPFLGALLSASYSKILAPPLAKRTQEFLQTVYERLLKLEHQTEGFKIENLSDNPMFITTFLHVYSIALRTHHEEKLEALRNVVINVAKPTDVEEDVSLMFTNWIDIFTRWHIKILDYLNERDLVIRDDRIGGRSVTTKTLEKVLENFEDLRGERAFASQIIKDLQDRGLIIPDFEPEFTVRKNADGSISESYTTALGKKFVKIIHS